MRPAGGLLEPPAMSKSDRFPGMNCGRGVAFSGAEASSKSDRFPGANCGRKAALGLGRGLSLGKWSAGP